MELRAVSLRRLAIGVAAGAEAALAAEVWVLVASAHRREAEVRRLPLDPLDLRVDSRGLSLAPRLRYILHREPLIGSFVSSPGAGVCCLEGTWRLRRPFQRQSFVRWENRAGSER